MNHFFNDRCCCPPDGGNINRNATVTVNEGPMPPLAENIPPQESFNSEEMQGSLQQILARYIGTYVVIESLIGTTALLRKQGRIYYVGRSYVILYDDVNNFFISCDMFSIMFVYFFYPGQRPVCNYNVLPPAAGRIG